MYTISDYLMPRLINDVISATARVGELAGCVLHLYNKAFGLSGQMTFSDFSLCTYSGYVDGTPISWIANPLLEADGTYTVLSNMLSFSAQTASPFVKDSIVGYMVSDGGTNVLFAEQFPQAIPVNQPGLIMGLVVKWNQLIVGPNASGEIVQ